MRRRLAAAVTIGALAMTGTALAASGGGPVSDIFGSPDQQRQEFANDLATKLGVSESRVDRALQSIEEQRRSEATQAMAEGIAAQLDGVNADDVARILEAEHRKLEREMQSGEVPRPPSKASADPLVAALAEGLGKSESEISQALRAAGKAEFQAHRGTAGPPPIGGPGGIAGPGGFGGPDGPGAPGAPGAGGSGGL